MPEHISINLKDIDLNDFPTPDEVKSWISSMNFTPRQYELLCYNRMFMKIMEQPLKETIKLTNEVLGLPTIKPKDIEINPS